MDPQVQAELAALIQKDMDLLRARAGDDGVLAYGRKPIPRDIPNERFLQNTLRDLGSANRRAEEDTLWASRDRQLALQQPRSRNPAKRRRSPTPTPSQSDSPDARASDPPAERPWDESDVAAAEMLSKRTVRGRGGVGSRAEEPGPFLPPEEGFVMEQAAQPVGPPRPAWLPKASEEAPPLAKSRPRVLGASGDLPPHRKEKKHKKGKHKHKDKDKEERKHSKSKKSRHQRPDPGE